MAFYGNGSNITNIPSPSSLSTSSGSAGSYSIRAWCTWNGTNGSVFSSANTSSMSRTNNGRFRWNLSSSMPTSNFAIAGCASYNDSHNDGNLGFVSYQRRSVDANRTTSGVGIAFKGGGDFPNMAFGSVMGIS